MTQVNRRLDALGAIAYLAERSDVDEKRIGLIGWSNGGSTVLAATNLRHRDVATATTRPAFAIAFYPGCEADLKRGYEPAAPLLMLVGELDDWTPSAPCVALARAAAEPRPAIESYKGAWHGFDSALPLRVRKDVPNGAHPGQGVHVGGNAAAWRDSRDRVVSARRPRRRRTSPADRSSGAAARSPRRPAGRRSPRPCTCTSSPCECARPRRSGACRPAR